MWPGLPLSTRFIFYVIQYAIEQEIEHMNEDDIEECVLGMPDAFIEEYNTNYSKEQAMLNSIQALINRMLEAWYHECE